jgi:hypothetical protein
MSQVLSKDLRYTLSNYCPFVLLEKKITEVAIMQRLSIVSTGEKGDNFSTRAPD